MKFKWSVISVERKPEPIQHCLEWMSEKFSECPEWDLYETIDSGPARIIMIFRGIIGTEEIQEPVLNPCPDCGTEMNANEYPGEVVFVCPKCNRIVQEET